MVGSLLLRGMLVGVVAGLLAFGFARVFGEPQVDRAIAFEEQMGRAKGEVPAPELVSRPTQAGIGLFTGVVVYSAAIGGLFSLAFAFVYGRVGSLGPRGTAALLALGGFVAIALVPDLKYPANPPSVGDPDTIGFRTELFFLMLVISVAALVLAVALARRLTARYGAWNATLLAGLAFVLVIAIAQYALPDINEVPEQFSAVVLWRFRVAALGIQVVLWTTIGLLFGVLFERSFAERFWQRLSVGAVPRSLRHRGQQSAKGQRHSIKFAILTLSACATRSSPALAADLTPPPVFTSGSPWEGFYAGGHVGGIFAGSSSFSTEPGFSTEHSAVPSAGRTSVVGVEHIDTAHELGPLSAGLDAGYNFVTASGLLLGVEADFSFPGILRSNLNQNIPALGPSVVNDNVQIYGLLGGRVGYTFGDWLVYGTGGFAYERGRLNTTDFATGTVDDNVYFWRPGWTAGAGVEVLLTANLSAKLEYAFFDFAHVSTFLPVAGERFNSDLTFQTVRLGLNYHFNDNPVAPGTTGGILPQSVRDNLSIHAQSTFIGQANAPFPAAYSGTNSLGPIWQLRDTFSLTGFFGYKEPYTGTEFYYNPEPFQGFGLSNTHGLAGFSNIEAQKAGFNFPHYNTARLFFRHVFGLGGEQEDIADGPNQVAAKEDISRLTFTFGKLAIGDIFDANTYSHDGRVSFMNWGLVDAGAFNYSADQQGYTYGTALELNQKDWAVRAGYFLVPVVSNAENFDTRIGRRGQAIVEVQHNYSLFGMDGVVRVLGFEEQFNAGSFAATLNNPFAINPDGTPDITATRKTRSQYGIVGNAELAVTKDLGLFARIGWWNGTSEMIYTDISQSISAGAVLTGTSWGRPLDKVGLAAAVSGISGSYQKFLSIGGLGVNIGDGALSYRPESIVETYYSVGLTENAALSFDYQFIANPGYNYVRGPVSIGGVRLHLQF